MLNEIKKGIPLYLAITTYLCYWDDFFTVENLAYFTHQFTIVLIVGILIALVQEYVVDWIYKVRGSMFRGFASRTILYSFLNVCVLIFVLTMHALFNPTRTVSEAIPSMVHSSVMVVCITVSYVLYYEYKYKQLLARKQSEA